MRSAYNEIALRALTITREARRWKDSHWITDAQWSSIAEAYKSPFYHPNIVIRILLFVATLIALSGVTGLFALLFSVIGESGYYFMSVVYGVGSFFFLKIVFIQQNQHYKSGVTEALLYHSCGYTLAGLGGLTDFNPHLLILLCLVVFAFAATRYLDLIATLSAMGAFGAFLFYELFNLGGIFQQIIPFAFIACFTPIYFVSRKMKGREKLWMWHGNLLIVESVSLLVIYLAGNYLVVRELSVNLMELHLSPGEDIPFAWIFYGLTILLPISFLYFGIRMKDIVLLRVSLIVLAASVLTFKYYYGFGHPEITLTIAGAVLLLTTLALFNYLKIMRNGFTRENLLAEKWGDANIAAFIVSQTLGGNQSVADDSTTPGGGEFGGGGSSGSF